MSPKFEKSLTDGMRDSINNNLGEKKDKTININENTRRIKD